MLGDIHSFNPDFSIILGDFNAMLNKWWVGDIQASEGLQIDYLTTSYGFRQIISEPTHILRNSSSCIGLIFTDQPPPPTPYKRLLWDFKRANIPSIRKAIKMVDWRFMFLNKNVHKQVSIFNNTLMNIFTNYIPNKYITIDDRDPHG